MYLLIMLKRSTRRKLASFMILLTCCAMVESSFSSVPRHRTYQSQISSELSFRQALEDMIEYTPGIYFRSTIRATNRTVGVIQYHLNWLTDNGQIISFEANNYKGYFPSRLGKLSEKKKRALIMLRVPHKKEILEILIDKGSTSQQNLTETLHLSDQSISYHLKILEEMGIITKVRNGLGKTIVLDEEIRTFLLSYIQTQ
jgi:predicted transcriptional regulator